MKNTSKNNLADARKRRLNHLRHCFLGLLCLLLSGCSGPDELRLCNHYPFMVTLWKDGNVKVGSVASNEEHLFTAIAYRGYGMEELSLSDSAGKSLGKLKTSGAVIRSEHVSIANGSTIWRVDVGPPGSAPKEFGNLSGSLSDLWALTPFIIFFCLGPFALVYLCLFVREKFRRNG